jgi:hypothetical protein
MVRISTLAPAGFGRGSMVFTSQTAPSRLLEEASLQVVRFAHTDNRLNAMFNLVALPEAMHYHTVSSLFAISSRPTSSLLDAAMPL